MPPIMSASQEAATALRRVECALRNWQDDPDGPRSDVNRMLNIIGDLRTWVQGYVIDEIETIENDKFSALNAKQSYTNIKLI